MKKINKYLFLVLMFSVNIIYLNADCNSDKEVAKTVAHNIYYESLSDIYLVLYNLNENVYVTISNDANDEIVNVYYNSPGYNIKEVKKTVKYKIEVHSKSCSNEVLKTINIDVPKINEYSFTDFCSEYSSKTMLCALNQDVENLTFEEFQKKVLKDAKWHDFKLSLLNIYRSIKSNIIYAIIPFILIGIYYIIKIVLYKRKKSK